LIIAAVQERRGIEVFVSPVVIEDRDTPVVMHPEVVGGDILGCVPQLHLSRQHGHGQGGAMCNKCAALIGVGGISGIAQGALQREFAVDIGGFDLHVAKDRFFLRRIFGVDVVADFGLKV
jgi:hypothetical protein